MHLLPPLLLRSSDRIKNGLFSHRAERIELSRDQTDPRALDRLGLETALRLGVIPLRPAGAVTPVAAASMGAFREAQPYLQTVLGPVACVLASRRQILAAIGATRDQVLASRAGHRTKAGESCRSWSGPRTAAIVLILTALVIMGAVFAPDALLAILAFWAALTLLAVTILRSVAALVEARQARKLSQTWTSHRGLRRPADGLPFVSLLIPLFDEKDIAQQLVSRLDRLDYPRSRLEVLLILEEDDRTTRMALEDVDLPSWMTIVNVPRGNPRTKPRALNYALDFTRGDIVGIYDAEDAPAPDQLLKVAQTFRNSGEETACVQGVLDFYNARQTWLTRCFAIDYATWFRLVLPGLVRLGFSIPLGGTTLFFRRDVLDRLGRWDAHNVTEDADLGLRLARRGYRVAFVPTVTKEEATATIPAWLRQRSRWIKGYAVTWAVHMRDPLRLWGELGTLRFIGVQILFLGTLSQFVLAPLLWSFWLVLLGIPHPLESMAPWHVIVALTALFVLCEIATLTVAALSVATPKHRWLIKWVPLLHLYFPLAAIASWKGYAELVSKPFYWDKTAHGRDINSEAADRDVMPPPHPV